VSDTRLVQPDETVFLDGKPLELVLSVDLPAGTAVIVATDWRTGERLVDAQGEYETVTVRGKIEIRQRSGDGRPVKERHADGSMGKQAEAEPGWQGGNPFNPYGTLETHTPAVSGSTIAISPPGTEPLRGCSADMIHYADFDPPPLTLETLRAMFAALEANGYPPDTPFDELCQARREWDALVATLDRPVKDGQAPETGDTAG
jgi:hypothetical protein